MLVKFRRRWWIFVVAMLVLYGFVQQAHSTEYDSTEQPKIRLAEVYFYDKSNKKMTLDDFKGEVVLVNLWAMWCGPCVVELPSLNALQAMFKDRGFKLVAVAQDSVSTSHEIEKFLYEKKMNNIVVYWDKDRVFMAKWKYSILPTSVLLDREGYVIKMFTGAFDWSDEALISEVRAALE